MRGGGIGLAVIGCGKVGKNRAAEALGCRIAGLTRYRCRIGQETGGGHDGLITECRLRFADGKVFHLLPMARTSLSELIGGSVHRSILNCVLKAGTELRAVHLARAFGASNSP